MAYNNQPDWEQKEMKTCPQQDNFCEDCISMEGEEREIEWECPKCDKGYCEGCSYSSMKMRWGEYEGESVCSSCYEEQPPPKKKKKLVIKKKN